MRPTTREWIEKAEADYGSAQREYRARKCPNYDAACFHAQQCAEKYMKAWLQEKARAVDKTHDLVRLMSHLPQTLSLQALRADLAVLSAAAVVCAAGVRNPLFRQEIERTGRLIYAA